MSLKKITNILFITILLMLGAVFYFQYNRKSLFIEEDIITIKEGFAYYIEEDSFSIDLFINRENHQIMNTNKNSYYLSNENKSILLTLEHISTYRLSAQEYKNTNYYNYHLIFKIPDINYDLFLKNAYLSVNMATDNIFIEIGNVSITKRPDTNLLFRDLFGIFNEVNGIKTLVGIGIELNSFVSSDLRFLEGLVFNINSAAISVYNGNLTNETNLQEYLNNYTYFDKSNHNDYLIKSNKILIPLSYDQLLLIRNPCLTFIINEVEYALDNFDYGTNLIQLSKYESIISRCIKSD